MISHAQDDSPPNQDIISPGYKTIKGNGYGPLSLLMSIVHFKITDTHNLHSMCTIYLLPSNLFLMGKISKCITRKVESTNNTSQSGCKVLQEDLFYLKKRGGVAYHIVMGQNVSVVHKPMYSAVYKNLVQ